ncbi:PucR C-terminal helix-turn-helix domain [Frankia torreyi]|uniref:PucR C-terminal helix-turn-helix domain n=1 Tax=Frankia torreyi TaxID=1856 RepID=A0A0D8B9X1_9ACTN|nr:MULTISPECIES: helix-turn-helix domain-containing protein [Frankia]KJE21078.1 PucR C-terminal helix-turn-helix domain [Frankia torreyi]KQM03654.1 PucR C-terminal helix-turn-helix domain [Frankia sp. CpI1-P]
MTRPSRGDRTLAAGRDEVARVIAYFDALSAAGAGVSALVRATAILVGCPAGLRAPGIGEVLFDPDGARAAAPAGTGRPPRDATRTAASSRLNLGEGREVWLARPGPPAVLDELVLERMAAVAKTALNVQGHHPPEPTDPALVELALSARESLQDRARALRLLDLVPEVPVRVAAVRVAAARTAADAGLTAWALALFAGSRDREERPVRVARVGRFVAVLCQQETEPRDMVDELRAAIVALGVPSGARERGAEASPSAVRSRGRRAAVSLAAVDTASAASRRRGRTMAPAPDPSAQPLVGLGGVVDGLDAGLSWRQAQLALRFAVTGPAQDRVVDYDGLGSLTLLAAVPPDRLRANADVRALDDLAATATGECAIAILDAFCRAGSHRQAATELHLHHSSVSARIAQLDSVLGWDLDRPEGRYRAYLALLARRLARRPESPAGIETEE